MSETNIGGSPGRFDLLRTSSAHRRAPREASCGRNATGSGRRPRPTRQARACLRPALSRSTRRLRPGLFGPGHVEDRASARHTSRAATVSKLEHVGWCHASASAGEHCDGPEMAFPSLGAGLGNWHRPIYPDVFACVSGISRESPCGRDSHGWGDHVHLLRQADVPPAPHR